MGKRKRLAAERRKEAQKEVSFAKLRNVPSSPRKMRLVADMVRGLEVNKAIGLLHFSTKHASRDLECLVKSAINNWEQKNERKAQEGELYIKTIFVDPAPMLKRLRPAPQGRAHRIRKRSNHVTIVVDTIQQKTNE